MLFVVGAGTSTYHPHLDNLGFIKWKRRALVDYAYAIGGCYFTVGSYLGFYEVINVGKRRRRWFAGPAAGLSLTGYWGSLSYFAGAVAFQVAVSAALFTPHLPTRSVFTIEWIPQATGGLLFTIAACIEWWKNRDATASMHVFWVCQFYLLGSLLFLFAASVGTYLSFIGEERKEWTTSFVDLPYMLGSLAFLLGAWVQLLMWKLEQFGLGFIGEINNDFAAAREQARVTFEEDSLREQARARREEGAEGSLEDSPEPGDPVSPACGRNKHAFAHKSGATLCIEKLFLAMYLCNGALSALNFSLSYVWHVYATFDEYSSRAGQVESLIEMEELTSDVTIFVASHSMLLLATAVHFTPTLQPYGYLLWLLRGVSLLFLFASILRCLKYISEALPTAPYGGAPAHASASSIAAAAEAAFPILEPNMSALLNASGRVSCS